MLRNICYTLMAGCVITSVWKMQNHTQRSEPSIEPHVVMETYKSSDAEPISDLLVWVNTIEKNSGLHPDDQAELFDSYFHMDFETDQDFRTPDLMSQLELGMSSEEVRSLLGDPIVDAQNEMLWIFDTAIVLFDKNRMHGWVKIKADSTMQAAIRRMQSWGNRSYMNHLSGKSRHLLSKRIPHPPGIMRSRVAYKGSPRRNGGFRSSVNRHKNSSARTRLSESKLYRKPQYLSNMFPSREVVRRKRDSRINRRNNRVHSYRRNSG